MVCIAIFNASFIPLRKVIIYIQNYKKNYIKGAVTFPAILLLLLWKCYISFVAVFHNIPSITFTAALVSKKQSFSVFFYISIF